MQMWMTFIRAPQYCGSASASRGAGCRCRLRQRKIRQEAHLAPAVLYKIIEDLRWNWLLVGRLEDGLQGGRFW
jgi:hypothetical protein